MLFDDEKLNFSIVGGVKFDKKYAPAIDNEQNNA